MYSDFSIKLKRECKPRENDNTWSLLQNKMA